jgi:hypothetical protein
MSFSEQFQAFLRAKVAEATISPDNFIAKMETAINSGYGRNIDGTIVIRIDGMLPDQNREACIGALRLRLEECGLKECTSGPLKKGQFSFLREETINQFNTENVHCQDPNKIEIFSMCLPY